MENQQNDAIILFKENLSRRVYRPTIRPIDSVEIWFGADIAKAVLKRGIQTFANINYRLDPSLFEPAKVNDLRTIIQ